MVTTSIEDVTVGALSALGGVPGAPARFRASYQGERWHASKVDDVVYLSRTCTGCWATGDGYAGMWSTRRHTVEESVTLEQVRMVAASIARLRAAGEHEVADARAAVALRIVGRAR